MHKIAAASMLAVALLGGLASGAAAQSEGVRYRDLDLSTAEGAATFRSRVSVAARRMCADQRNVPGSNRNGSAACEESFRREIERQLPEASRLQLSASDNADAVVSAR